MCIFFSAVDRRCERCARHACTRARAFPNGATDVACGPAPCRQCGSLELLVREYASATAIPGRPEHAARGGAKSSTFSHRAHRIRRTCRLYDEDQGVLNGLENCVQRLEVWIREESEMMIKRRRPRAAEKETSAVPFATYRERNVEARRACF